jgi:hypothetical protein
MEALAFSVPIVPVVFPLGDGVAPGGGGGTLVDGGAGIFAERTRDWLREITELLLTGGYFRARIPSLPAFDKIIGGLAWSITASYVDVDLDLFYDDNIRMGQKIRRGQGGASSGPVSQTLDPEP